MSNFTTSLPTEVWLIIFNKVYFTHRLGPCRLVCKSWKPLVEKVMFKELNLLAMDKTLLATVSEYLATRPEIGRLVQRITVSDDPAKWSVTHKILRRTPNLKVIDGKWSEVLATIVLHRPEYFAMKFEKLPCIKHDIELHLKSMLRFKDTLRSAAFSFNGDDDYDYHDIGSTLNQFKHLQHLTIEDEYAFKSLRDLDCLLSNCNQIQQLRLTINEYDGYIRTDKVELEQWLANSVQRVETAKTLTIHFEYDWFEEPDNGRQPREFGPDWMEYLGYKYPNATRLEVGAGEYHRQHLILPKFMHMDTFVLTDWKFYDMDVLSQFIDTLATQSVSITCEVSDTTQADPYICLMSAVKRAPTDCTKFSILLPYNGSIEASTVSVMSLFSSRLVKYLELDLDEDDDLETICASMKCNLNVESFKITTDDLLLTECPEEPISATLHTLEIVNTRFQSNFLTQLSKYAPRSLTHLTLGNCIFGDKVSMPSTQLASLSLQNTNREDMAHQESILFSISANRCPEQIILASPQKPLQRVTKGEARLLKAPTTIYIECGSLKHLSVDLQGIRFEMKCDDADNLLKPVNSDIEDSHYTTLERNMKLLEEGYKKMKTRTKVAEDRYSKSKEYLDDLQIKAIEDSVPPK